MKQYLRHKHRASYTQESPAAVKAEYQNVRYVFVLFFLNVLLSLHDTKRGGARQAGVCVQVLV